MSHAASGHAMLIITRRKGQRICIGHDIEIVVIDITRSGVKLGVVAPRSLLVLRGEVRDAIEQANRDAAASNFAEPSGVEPAHAEPGDEPRPVPAPSVAAATR